MEITLVNAAGLGDRDRAYLKGGDVARRGPIHIVHDLPHLVVESLFGIADGVWGELAPGFHAAAGQAASARDPKRQKQGRIVSGAAAGARTGQWLTPGHRRAKTITNCVTNRRGDGPDTPAGSASGWPGPTTRRCKTCSPGPMTRRSPRLPGACGTWSDAGWRYRLAASSRWSGRWHVISSPGRQETRGRPVTRTSPTPNIPLWARYGSRTDSGIGDHNGGYLRIGDAQGACHGA